MPAVMERYLVTINRAVGVVYVRNNKAASKKINSMIACDFGTRSEPGAGNSQRNRRLSADEIAELRRQGLLVFTFVRNPYGRFVSGYNDKLNNYTKQFRKLLHFRAVLHQLISGPSAWRRHRSKIEYLQRYISPDDLLDVLERDGTAFNKHFTEQATRVGFGEVTHDFIGKIETFQQDMLTLGSRLGIADLTRVGDLAASRVNESGGSLVLSKRQEERVRKVYARDFQAFSY